MLSQFNALENSRQSIDNTHNNFHVLASITTEMLDNIQKDQSNFYFREESKKECQEEITQNKATNYWSVFKETSIKDTEELKDNIR